MNFRDTLKVNEAGHLEIGGCDTLALAERFGTPLYVMDEAYIRGVIRAYKNTICKKYGSGNVAYASKAFSSSAIYKIAAQEDILADAVSWGEIYTALSAGFPAENIIFHGNNKLVGEITSALAAGVGIFVVDDLGEIELLADLAKQAGVTQKVMIRANPGVDAHTHKYIQTATTDSKFGFGIASGEAVKAIRHILAFENLHFCGLNCHIGSQIFDKKAYELAVDIMTDFIRELKKQQIGVDILDIGGGFGVHYTEGDPKYTVLEYAQYIEAIVSKLLACIDEKKIEKPALIIEPGRSVVGEAGITLYSVGNVKEIPNIKKYITIDGGMTDNIRPALYQAEYEAVLAGRVNEAPEEEVAIAGKCCESSDIIIQKIKLPKARRGDILAVFSTGAYNYSMASNYNKIPRPGVVLVRDGKADYIVRPETVEELSARDCLPDWL